MSHSGDRDKDGDNDGVIYSRIISYSLVLVIIMCVGIVVIDIMIMPE